jgi:hypothetical protein
MRRWTRLRAGLAVCALTATALTCIPSMSSADIMTFGRDPFSVGFATTFSGIGGGGQGNIVDFAVLRPNSAFDNILSSSYAPFQGSPSFDSSKWTYLYQVANAAPSVNPQTLQSFAFSPPQQSGIQNFATSIGTFSAGNFRLDFTNEGTIVNAQGNNLQSVNDFGLAASLVQNSAINHLRIGPSWIQRINMGFPVSCQWDCRRGDQPSIRLPV